MAGTNLLTYEREKVILFKNTELYGLVKQFYNDTMYIFLQIELALSDTRTFSISRCLYVKVFERITIGRPP